MIAGLEVASNAEAAFQRQKCGWDDVEHRRDLREHLEEARLTERQVEPDRRAHPAGPAAVGAGSAEEEHPPAQADVPVELRRLVDQLRLPQIVEVDAGAAVAVPAIAD